MKKISAIAVLLGLSLLGVQCKSVDKNKMGNQEVIMVSEVNPVIFTAWGAPAEKCIKELHEQGGKKLVHAEHGLWGGIKIGDSGLFSSSRLSSSEYCRAVGTK